MLDIYQIQTATQPDSHLTDSVHNVYSWWINETGVIKMGAWSEETFGNDIACDWADAFLGEPTLTALEKAVRAVLHEDGYIDSDVASECLAACEVIARQQGRWGLRNHYSQELDTWIENNPMIIPHELRRQAVTAINMVLSESSELYELWFESDSYEAWVDAAEDLRQRIKG
ncbi:MAG: DUF4259 domain-containing protein [Chloroflexota bacterium]